MRLGKTYITLVMVGFLISLSGIVQAADLADNESSEITTNYSTENKEKNIVVYINWDGFARYYLDLAEHQGRIPTLSRIKNEEGVYFENAYTGIPSITNPRQAAIASGTTPRFTDNHYRYFNKKLNMIIQEQPATKNEAETLAEAAVRQNLSVISINQFAFQDRGTVIGDPVKSYIIAPPGVNGYSDAIARFDEAIKLIKTSKSGDISYEKLPRFIALYMDDLDGIGHNAEMVYGVAPAVTEEARKQAVIDRLAVMDEKLNELIKACKDAGLYENMSFILTTDHGMALFGSEQPDIDDYAQTKLSDLIATIETLGPGYKCEILHPNKTLIPSLETNIVIVTVGLQVQLSYVGEFDPAVINAKNARIAEILNDKNYIGKIMFPDEIVAQGVKPGFADLIISPKPPYHFRLPDSASATARGQHDSLSEEAQHIASFMWGRNIKKGLTYKEIVHNYDFTPTMAKLLGINAPLDATGRVLYDVLDLNKNLSWEYNITYEAEDALGAGSAKQLLDEEASGGKAIIMNGNLEVLGFTAPATKKMIIKYATFENAKLALYINDSFVRNIFFPSTDGLTTKFTEKIINLTLYGGESVKFIGDMPLDQPGISIDYITFISEYIKP